MTLVSLRFCSDWEVVTGLYGFCEKLYVLEASPMSNRAPMSNRCKMDLSHIGKVHGGLSSMGVTSHWSRVTFLVDDGKVVDICMDFSKIFDTISHSILMATLSLLLMGSALDSSGSFLELASIDSIRYMGDDDDDDDDDDENSFCMELKHIKLAVEQ
ncbi:hypothetical protein DUI87_12903 [Hirundo rustica rustica]|uniref:Reverse transcriptase domain-containing protein n=1 Tax=Hirundo rustica rustica TaxID=333673 RepID=A0A3M0KAL3_HIRRU|nr:hypothetical protein DUI87_12903 [Hirundo rustica rustica]